MKKVVIELESRNIRCEVYLEENQRLSDMLNDGRDFLPVITKEGKVKFIRKTTILSVTEEATEKALNK